ncbi:MAG: hypothetical protein EKK52_10265 [Burkholderiales bacterium]|uniref:hypothetical protein n=1 Tax=Roseateles sp. TaxID=1971397 RepID=UPI000FAD41C6|nr:MAG: hypothetical protein EKK52_10265 [Burkholderiales bacterium]
MNAHPYMIRKYHLLKAGLFSIGIAALPNIATASTFISATAQTYGTTTTGAKDSKGIGGTAGQEVQYRASANTFEIGHSATATAYADAKEGTLRAAVRSSAATTASTTDTGSAEGYATATWDDTMTVNAGNVLKGNKGYIVATIDISGSFAGTTGLPDAADSAEHNELIRIIGTGIDSSSTPRGYGCGGWSLCGYHDYATWGVDALFSNIQSVIPLRIPITFGAATHLNYTLDLTSLAWTHSRGGGSGISASAFVDYAHTMNWGGISGVYDANNVLVGNITTTSASGFNYLDAAPVPEPERYALFLAGFGIMSVVSRLRNQPPRVLRRRIDSSDTAAAEPARCA